MSDIACPQCGQITTLPAIRRAFDEFCTHCDFPLFWAPTAVPMAQASVGSDTTLRRLPGAGGRQTIGTQVCPVCGELNSVAAKLCTRCGSDLNPPVLVVVAAPEPVFIPAPPQPEVREPIDWTPWVVALVLAMAIAAIIFLL